MTQNRLKKSKTKLLMKIKHCFNCLIRKKERKKRTTLVLILT
jgi:hypothetical protein